MKLWRRAVLFYLGGTAYMTLEFLWRGRSHGSMFLLGGSCFLILGQLRRLRLPMWAQAILGAAAVTVLELAAGLTVNRAYAVWDYRALPFNWHGQICLAYSLLWVPVSMAGMLLYGQADRLTFRHKRG